MYLEVFMLWFIIWIVFVAMSIIEKRGIIFGFLAGIWILFLGVYIYLDGLQLFSGLTIDSSTSTAVVVEGTSTVTDVSTTRPAEITVSSGTITAKVEIPAGAFSSDVSVTVTILDPDALPTAAVTAAGNQTEFDATDVILEISNNLDLQPTEDITLTLTYGDADVTGIFKDAIKRRKEV